MAAMWFACFLFAILQWETYSQVPGPPKVTGSYKAAGEIVTSLEDESKLHAQMAFEESFDADTNNAVFQSTVMGINVTYVENFNTRQTFRYSMDSGSVVCDLMTVQEWIKTDAPPSLLHYEHTNGTVRFSLKQLFALNQTHLKETSPSVFRGIPATKWLYEIKGIDKKTNDKLTVEIEEYWSDPSWNTTSNNATAPLGYAILKVLLNETTEKMDKVGVQYINIFSFVPDTIDQKLFEPIGGIFCENRTQTLPFPNVNRIEALMFFSELILPSYLEIKYVDTWLDTRNKLCRVDMERMKEEVPVFREKDRKYQSEIAVAQMGVVFQKTNDKMLSTCKVIPFDEYDLDIQNLFNYKLPPRDWLVGKIFGLNQTSYVYLGKGTRKDTPCHVFQGIRKDWPYPEANVTSLWEWCFSTNVTNQIKDVIFANNEYGLISAEVKIIESKDIPEIPSDMKMIYHFYNVNVKKASTMDSRKFDISRCFEEHQKRRLQFIVDWEVTHENLIWIENATSDMDYLQKWKSALYFYSGLQSYTLRITEVSSVVAEKKLYVKFTILDPHKDLPKDIAKTQIEASKAEEELRSNIKKGTFKIIYTPSKTLGPLNLTAVQGSLRFQMDQDVKLHTTPPTSPHPGTGPTTEDFSLIVPDDDKTTPSKTIGSSKGTPPTPKGSSATENPSTGTTPITNKKRKTIFKGHTPGTVAGVSIAMLLVGITIGSAGTFIKFNGMPSCLSNMY